MKFKKEWLDHKWVAYSVAGCITVLFYLIFSNLRPLFSALGMLYGMIRPIILGIIVAYVLNPLMVLFEQKVFYKIKRPHLRRNLSIAAECVALGIFFAILLYALIPQIIASIGNFVNNISYYAAGLSNMIQQFGAVTAAHDLDLSAFTQSLTGIIGRVSSVISENADRIVKTSVNVGRGIFTGVICFILAIYFLADKENLLKGVRRVLQLILPEKRYTQSVGFWRRCNSILIRYIGFDLIDGLIIGVINYIFMKIVGMPYAVVISVAVGLTNLAPTFGPIVGGVIGAFILVLVNPWHALTFIIFTVVLQTFDGYILKPKMFGNTLGVPGVWILITLIVGGRMFGVLGILLAIPFAAIVSFLIDDLLERMDTKKAQKVLVAEKAQEEPEEH